MKTRQVLLREPLPVSIGNVTTSFATHHRGMGSNPYDLLIDALAECCDQADVNFAIGLLPIEPDHLHFVFFNKSLSVLYTGQCSEDNLEDLFKVFAINIPRVEDGKASMIGSEGECQVDCVL